MAIKSATAKTADGKAYKVRTVTYDPDEMIRKIQQAGQKYASKKQSGVSPTVHTSGAQSSRTAQDRITVQAPTTGSTKKIGESILMAAKEKTQERKLSYELPSDRLPTAREILARIATIAQTDTATAEGAFEQLKAFQQDKNSPYYNPYTAPTNTKAIEALAEYGIDAASVSLDELLETYGGYLNYARTVTGYAPLAPTNSSTPEQNIAYWLQTLIDDEKTTGAAESEWTELQREIAYWAGNPKSYSDQEVLDRIDWSKYPTLQKMDEGRERKIPLALNRAVGYSEDSLYGAIWAARNGGGTGNSTFDAANYTLGLGNKYKRDLAAAASRDPYSPDYNPYAYGTMDDVRMRVGDQTLNRDWLDSNRWMLESTNEADLKLYQRVQGAVENREALDAEWASLGRTIAELVRQGLSDKEIRARIDPSAYKTLQKLDESKQTGKLLDLAEGVNYSLEYVDGLIWAARNGGGSGDAKRDTQSYAAGRGKQYVPNPEAEAARTPGTDAYDPYSRATYATNAEWDPEDTTWQQYLVIDEKTGKPRNPGADATPEQADAWARHQAQSPGENAAAAKEELLKLNALIDKWVNAGHDGDRILKLVQDQLESEFTTLGKMETYRKEGGYLPLTEAVDFTLPKMEAEIKRRVAERDEILEREAAAALEQEIARQFTWGSYDAVLENVGQYSGEIEANNFATGFKQGISDWLSGKEVDNAVAKAWTQDFGYLLGNPVQRTLLGEVVTLYDSRETSVTSDGKRSKTGIGETALNALKTADSEHATQSQRVELALQISRDMEEASAYNLTLDEFYQENGDRAQALAWIDRAVELQGQEAQARYAQEREYVIKSSKASLDGAMARWLDGTVTAEDAEILLAYSQTEYGLTDGKDSAVYTDAFNKILLNYGNGDLHDAAARRKALDVFSEDGKYAKMLGLTLDELYERYPDMAKTVEDAYAYAEHEVNRQWNAQEAESKGLLAYLFGENIALTAENEGVGVGQTLLNAGARGGLEFAGGWVSAADWLMHRESETTTVGDNRHTYGSLYGMDGRARYKRDAMEMIGELTDEDAKAYWTEQFENPPGGDVYNVAFNMDSQAMQELNYRIGKRLAEVEDFMLENATTAEYAAYTVGAGVVQNLGNLTIAAGVTGLTGGMSTAGLLVGYGTPTFGDSAQSAFERGRSVEQSKMIGMGSAFITALTEKIPFDNYMARVLGTGGAKQAVLQGGSKVTRTLYRIAAGGSKIAADAGAEGIQEFTESLATGVYSDLMDGVGLSGIDWNGLLEDAGREGVMGALTSPFLQAYSAGLGTMQYKVAERVLTSGQELGISDLEALAAAKAQDEKKPAFSKNTLGKALEIRQADLMTQKIGDGAMEDVMRGPEAAAAAQARKAYDAREADVESARQAYVGAKAAEEKASKQFLSNALDQQAKSDLLKKIEARKQAQEDLKTSLEQQQAARAVVEESEGAFKEAQRTVFEGVRGEARQQAAAEMVRESARTARSAPDLDTEINTYLDEAGLQGAERDAARRSILQAEVLGARQDTQAAAPANTKVLDALTQSTGLTFVFDENIAEEGNYDPATRTIAFGRDASVGDVWMGVLKHEISHFAEGSAEYESYAAYVLNYEYGQSAEQLDTTVREKVSQYARQGIALTEEQARAEVVADLTRDVILRDDAALVRLARENRTLGQKVLRWISGLVNRFKALGRGKNYAEYDRLQRAEKLLKKALDTVPESAGQGEARYSVRQLPDGTKYVKVDVDQERFEGLTGAELAAEAKRAIKERFVGQVIGEAPQSAFVNSRFAGKYTYEYDRMSSTAADAKMRASTTIDELMRSATFIEHRESQGKHAEATGGWDYYKAVFEVAGQFFGGRIAVKNTANGRLLYDIAHIKEIAGNNSLSMTNATDAISTSDSTTSIPGSNENDNPPKLFSAGNNAAADFRQWVEKRRERYGTIERGENAARDANVPRQTSEKLNARRFTRTFLESGSLTEAVTPAVAKALMEEALSYQTVSDKRASDFVDLQMRQGEAAAAKTWERSVNGDRMDKATIALGERLLHDAAARGDAETTVRLLAEIAEAGTRAGQVVQAMRMLKKIGGAGQLYYIQRSVDSVNRQLAGRGRPRIVAVNEDLALSLAEARSEGEIERAANAIMQDVADQMPPSWVDKWNAWRYLSMLGNPRTHIRNIVGNAVFVPVVKMKNLVAAGLERTPLAKGERSKSVVVGSEYKAFAAKDFAEMQEVLSGGGKMNPTDQIQEKRRSFGESVPGRALEWLSNVNSNLLELEDLLFLKAHYQSALGGYLQANKVDLAGMDAATLEKARDYAVNEAQKATYRDASKLATALNKLARTNKATELFVEGALPFKKTPINILKRGVEYSPVGLLNAISRGTYQLRKGKISATQWIDGIASGLTGTAVMGAGMLLSSLGYLTGSIGDTPEDDFQKLLGGQEYAIQIGGVSYTLDWMTPAAMPLFVGVELWNAMNQGTEAVTFGDVWGAVSGITEPAFNLSMLDGINTLIESANYSENGIASIFEAVASSYVSQAVPTVFGQVARTVDPVRRRTYTDKNSGAPGSMQLFAQRMINKTPGASMSNEPWVNKWGEQDVETNVLVRIFENFFSPGYINRVETDEVERELQALYQATQNDAVLPRDAAKYFSVDGQRVDLTAEQYTEFATARGQTAKAELERLMGAPEYETLTDRQKADAIADVYTYANSVAKAQVSGYELESWQRTANRSGEVTKTVVKRQVEAEDDRIVTAFRENLYDAILRGDMESMYNCVEALELAGKKKAGIKSSVSGRMERIYREAYEDGDVETVSVIEDMLYASGLGYRYGDFVKWVEEEE